MVPEEQSVPASSKPDQAAWPRMAMWTSITLIVVVGGLILLRSCFELPERALVKTSETIEQASQALATVAAAFRHGTITTSFVSYATTITNSQHLQFATLKQMEIFTRTETPSTAFGYVPLPDVVVEARAPVEYTYYIDLNAKWDLVLSNDVLHVFAPPIRANRPSVDVSALTYEVKRGHFKTTEARDNLKGTITSLAILRAKDNIPLVLESGRRQTTEFVERWLLRSFADGKKYPVKVYFPGEAPTQDMRILTPSSG